MHRTRRFVMTTAAAAALTVGAALGASPASAAEKPSLAASGLCVVPPLSLSCKSGAVAAGSDGTIYYSVSTSIAACQMYVRDVVTGVAVRYDAGVYTFGGKVTGLTNSYRLELN